MAAKMGMKLGLGLGSNRLLQQSAARRLGAGRRPMSVVAAVPPEVKEEIRERLPIAVAGLTLSSPAAAHAADAPTVDSAVSSIVDIVKATGEVVKQGVTAAQTGVEYAKSAYDVAAPVVREAVEAATPVLERGVKTAVDVAGPALQSGLKEAEKALTSSGVDTSAAKPLVAGTEQAVSTAKPFVEQAINFLVTSEPVVLGQYAAGLIAAYYLAPPLLSAGVGLLRGYAGDVTPAAALNAVESESGSFIVDIRSVREKEAGTPDIPNAGKLVELEYAAIEDRKVRSQLRSATDLEVKVTALQIAALKRLGRTNTVYILDRSGSGTAKAVAKALAARGFGRVYVITGGFNGWVASKLRTKTAAIAFSRVEILAPGTFGTGSTRTSSNGSGKIGTGKAVTTSSRRALPSTTSGSQ